MHVSPHSLPALGDAEIIHVDSLGAVPDGKTDSGPAIRKAIQRARSLGRPATIQLSKGEYAVWPKGDTYEYRRFGMVMGGEQRCCLVIDHAKDVTFTGMGYVSNDLTSAGMEFPEGVWAAFHCIGDEWDQFEPPWAAGRRRRLSGPRSRTSPD